MKRCVLILALLLPACPSKEREPSGASASASPAQAGALIPLAVGQWTRHRVTREDGTVSTMRYQVVGEEQGAFWVEVASGDGTGTVVQLLMRAQGSGELVAARLRAPTGEIKESRGAEFEKHKEGFRKAIAGTLLPKITGLPQKDITVPAGSFKGCYEEERTTTVSEITTNTRTYVHPSVPITGLVKSETIGEKHVMELEAFGLSGAKSSM